MYLTVNWISLSSFLSHLRASPWALGIMMGHFIDQAMNPLMKTIISRLINNEKTISCRPTVNLHRKKIPLEPAVLPLRFYKYTSACDGFDRALRLLNLTLTPHHTFSTISRQLATNVLIHLLVPLCFFELCLSTIKIDRSEERGGGEKKNVPLDWSCVHPGKISLKYNPGFQCCSYNSQAIQRSIFLKLYVDRQMHTHKNPFHALLI